MKGKFEELSMADLDKALQDNKVELRKERFKTVTSKVDNPMKFKELRRNIARILTLKNEYKLGIRETKVK